MNYGFCGYGELEDELIKLLSHGTPDFEKAEELIKKGADVNAVGERNDENVLSEILSGYGQLCYDEDDECEDTVCDNVNKRAETGKAMCQIIRFFLSHGFDVNKFDGCYGAQCLYALVLSTFDKYFIEATKILLDAGARNRTVSQDAGDESCTPWEFVAEEGSYQDICEYDHSTGNIYEAVYQMYLAVDEGRPYKGIDSYENSIGKKILKVLAVGDSEEETFYQLDLPEFKKENCYTKTLYFVYEGGALITTQYADFWVDTEIPEDGFSDVSGHFPGIVGETIKEFKFAHKSVVKGTTHYGQPITTIKMESGASITFSINFGCVKDDERAAFFEIEA